MDHSSGQFRAAVSGHMFVEVILGDVVHPTLVTGIGGRSLFTVEFFMILHFIHFGKGLSTDPTDEGFKSPIDPRILRLFQLFGKVTLQLLGTKPSLEGMDLFMNGQLLLGREGGVTVGTGPLWRVQIGTLVEIVLTPMDGSRGTKFTGVVGLQRMDEGHVGVVHCLSSQDQETLVTLEAVRR